MGRILVVQSGTLGTGSYSRLLVDEIVERLEANGKATEIVIRDLALWPVPHADTAFVTALRTRPEQMTEQHQAILRQSDVLIDELAAADLVVLGSPMYNLGIPSVLKAYVDHVVRAGRTFRATPEGIKGLLAGKRVLAVLARGGIYSEGHFADFDFQKPYLAAVFGMIGLEASFIAVEGTGMGPDFVEPSLKAAREAIASHPWLAA